MQTYVNTFAAAGSWELNVPGKYFALLGCTNVTNITFFKGGKKLDLGDITGVLSGLECTLGNWSDPASAFDRVKITASAADTITVGIGNGQVRYNRGATDAKIINAAGLFTHAAATVTTASGLILAQNIARRYLLVQNKDFAGNIWVHTGNAAATQANGIKIAPGGSLELTAFCPTDNIYAIGDIASNANIVVVSGQ